MSDGVYRSLVDATDTEHVNADIASMVASEFSRQSTLNGVGQAVIDRITRKHHDANALSKPGELIHTKCSTRDDMTLLIRNLNYRLRSYSIDKTLTQPTNASASPSSMSSSTFDDRVPTDFIPTSTTNNLPRKLSNPFFAKLREQPNGQSLIDTYIDSNPDSSFADSIKSNASVAALELDADGRIESYVSFAEFDAALAAMTETEREEFEKLLVPKMDYETIIEQPEGLTEPASLAD